MHKMVSLQQELSLSTLASYPYNILVGITVIGGALGGAIFVLRKYISGGVCRSKALLDGKTVIITGANTGIGKETAVDLARRNARVILACRSQEKGEKAAVDVRKRSGNDSVVFRRLDLASLASVRQFAAKILEEEVRVDILINNAGIMGCPYTKTENGFEMQFGVNHLGHFLLTNLLLERMKEAPATRIIILASELYKLCPGINFEDLNSENTYNPLKGYGHGKLANILFTRTLERRLNGTNITVNAVSPGVVRTELGRHRIKEVPPVLRIFAYLFQFILFKTPWQGSQTTIYCAVDEEVEGVSGKYFKDCHEHKLRTAAATDDAMAERLWQVSAQMVGLEDDDSS